MVTLISVLLLIDFFYRKIFPNGLMKPTDKKSIFEICWIHFTLADWDYLFQNKVKSVTH